jgi:hypothetical protein
MYMTTKIKKEVQTTAGITAAIIIFAFHAAAAPYAFQGLPGGWSPASVEQTVVAPCHASPSVKLSGARFDHSANDVPIVVEFRAPGVSFQSEPTHIRVFTVRSDVSRTETFSVPGHESGCGAEWRVRIVPTTSSTRDGRVIGDFSLSFTSTASIMKIEDAAILANGRSTTKNIGGSNGLHQGWVEITGTWNHSVYGVPGPLPVKLTYALLKPNGDIAAFDTGHSNHEFNPCCSGDKMKLRFRVTENINGQWKLRITNDSGQDAMTIIPKAIFKPACK